MMIRRTIAFSLLFTYIASPAFSQAPQKLSPNTGVRGTVQEINQNSISIASTLGLAKAKLGPGVTFFKRVPSSLAKVTPQSFIGVTTVHLSDGSEKATEIHIFPESLRGSGEGSRMMGQPAEGTTQNRMTNGTVSQSRMTNGTVANSKMTNGTVSGSRMTNGTVQKATGQSSMIVDFGNGKQPVVIPPNVTVTGIVPTEDRPKVGDSVFFVPEQLADGSYTTKKITLTTPVSAK